MALRLKTITKTEPWPWVNHDFETMTMAMIWAVMTMTIMTMTMTTKCVSSTNFQRNLEFSCSFDKSIWVFRIPTKLNTRYFKKFVFHEIFHPKKSFLFSCFFSIHSSCFLCIFSVQFLLEKSIKMQFSSVYVLFFLFLLIRWPSTTNYTLLAA